VLDEVSGDLSLKAAPLVWVRGTEEGLIRTSGSLNICYCSHRNFALVDLEEVN